MPEDPTETVVFVARYPLTARLRSAWGFDSLADAGFRVVVLDMRPLLAPWMSEAHPAESIGPAQVMAPRSFRELDVIVGGLAPDSVFIETIVATADADWDGFRVLRVLARHAAVIYAMAAGDLPHPSQVADPAGRRSLLHSRLKRATDVGQLLAYARRKSISLGMRRFGLAPFPARVFGTRSETVRRFFERTGVAESRFVPVNAPDYERYREIAQTDPQPAVTETCVFVDMNFMAHPDIGILSLPEIEPERYLASMNRLFDEIERDTGWEVVIAAHPTAAYDDRAYGGRRIVYGQTPELIASSRCVISHASTAVGYAVLWRKPLLLVVTDGLVRAGYDLDAVAIATALGTEARNVDHWSPDREEDDYLSFNEAAYESYQHEFLMSTESADRSSWDLVAEYAHRDIAERRAATPRS